MTFLKQTRKLIKASGLRKREIYLGAGVGQRWLDYLINDDDRDFRLNGVQRVYDFLSSRPASNSVQDPIKNKASQKSSQ